MTDLNFAGQFDRPFLLDETGSEVARVLGRLTNVTLLFEAAREGSRRKGEVTRDLKKAEAEIARLTADAARFANLRQQIAAVESAEAAVAAASQAEARATRLRSLTVALRDAQARSAAIVLPEAPDLSRLEQLAGQRERLASLTSNLGHVRMAVTAYGSEATVFADEERQAEAEAAAILAEAGRCPTCGRAIDGHADQAG